MKRTEVFAIAGIVAICALVLAAVLVYARNLQTVVRVDDAGAFVSTTYHPGLIDSQTSVHTSGGEFIVEGAFNSINHDARFELETRATGDRFLCDRSTPKCYLLAN